MLVFSKMEFSWGEQRWWEDCDRNSEFSCLATRSRQGGAWRLRSPASSKREFIYIIMEMRALKGDSFGGGRLGPQTRVHLLKTGVHLAPDDSHLLEEDGLQLGLRGVLLIEGRGGGRAKVVAEESDFEGVDGGESMKGLHGREEGGDGERSTQGEREVGAEEVFIEAEVAEEGGKGVVGDGLDLREGEDRHGAGRAIDGVAEEEGLEESEGVGLGEAVGEGGLEEEGKDGDESGDLRVGEALLLGELEVIEVEVEEDVAGGALTDVQHLREEEARLHIGNAFAELLGVVLAYPLPEQEFRFFRRYHLNLRINPLAPLHDVSGQETTSFLINVAGQVPSKEAG